MMHGIYGPNLEVAILRQVWVENRESRLREGASLAVSRNQRDHGFSLEQRVSVLQLKGNNEADCVKNHICR